jgi:hypothetical protein
MPGTALTHRSSAEARRLLPRGLETPPSKATAAVAQQGGDPWSSSVGSEDDYDGFSLSLSLVLDTRSSSRDEVPGCFRSRCNHFMLRLAVYDILVT